MPAKKTDEKVFFAKDAQGRWQTGYNCASHLLARVIAKMTLKEINDNRRVITKLLHYCASQVAKRITLEFNRELQTEWDIEKQIRELKKQLALRRKSEEEINKIEF